MTSYQLISKCEYSLTTLSVILVSSEIKSSLTFDEALNSGKINYGSLEIWQHI